MKNKKSLIALVALLVVGVVGSTFAYFTTTKTFNNIFKTEEYKTTVSETFKSPANWTPGQTADKVVNVKNEGDVEIAVRVKLVQTWKNGENELSLTQTTDNETWNVAEINFANSANWEFNAEDGYYYYKTVLASGQEALPLFDSVTYNAKMTNELAGIECVEVVNGDTITETCTSGSGYAGATYTLDVTVETIQADAATEANGWKYTPAA